MSLRRISAARGLGLIPAACLLALGACASTEATSRRMLDLNKQALGAFEAGEYPRARDLLVEAVAIGKGAGLQKHNTMARTYLDLGAVYLALQERDKGLRHLGLALRIDPEIQPSTPIATAPLKKTLASARAQIKRRRGQQVAKQDKRDDKPREAVPPPAPEPKPAAPPPSRAVVEAPPPAKPPTPAPAKASPPASPPPAPVLAKAPPPPPEPDDEEPDLPANVPQPLYCPTPDEAPPEAQIALRCVTRPGVAVSRMMLYYRSAGSETFTPVPMVRSQKGWYAGLVPASAVVGKSLQYYVEAQGTGKKAATTSNGHSDSPNLMSIRPGAALVGQGALAAARFKRPASAANQQEEEDPLTAAERERSREEVISSDHRRRPRAIFFGAGIGSGYGWHPARVLEFRSDQKVGAGFSPGGLLQLALELGYQLDPRYAVSVQLRYQMIPESGSGEIRSGNPKHSALAVFAHGYRLFGEGNGQLFLSATLGGGQGFRLVVPPHPEMGLSGNDTVRGGPIVVGPGAGYIHHFSRHFALLGEARLLAGVPDLAAVLEFTAAGQLAF